MNKKLSIFFLLSILIIDSTAISQNLDVDKLLEKIDRLEKNVSDLQKGKFDSLDKSLSSGYISRNEHMHAIVIAEWPVKVYRGGWWWGWN